MVLLSLSRCNFDEAFDVLQQFNSINLLFLCFQYNFVVKIKRVSVLLYRNNSRSFTRLGKGPTQWWANLAKIVVSGGPACGAWWAKWLTSTYVKICLGVKIVNANKAAVESYCQNYTSSK